MTIKVGDFIGFKSDVEQYAEVIEVNHGKSWDGVPEIRYIVKAGPDGFSGDYIGRYRTHEIHESDVFED